MITDGPCVREVAAVQLYKHPHGTGVVSIGLRQSAIAAHGQTGARGACDADPFAPRHQIAVIVPCFNEREALPQLFERLRSVEETFANPAGVHWCFVDDGSTDGTWEALREHTEQSPNRTAVRHEVNQGLSAAILTGIAHTDAPIVCSIDADCTYDPVQLPAMLARLEDGASAVTASPYHPDGGVSGVAAWRLALSKLASAFYRRLSRNKLHTYTSCFRAYRREAIEGIRLRHPRFAGVAEMLWHVDRRGGKVVEHPIMLHSRKVGRSKLRVVPVILDHVSLLSRCTLERTLRPRRFPRSADLWAKGEYGNGHHSAECGATPVVMDRSHL